MKSKKYILILMFISCYFFISCHENTINKEFLQENDIIENNFQLSLSEVDGIISSNYTFSDNKFYFWLMKKYETSNLLTGRSMIAYVNLETGLHHYICTDVLCSHTEIEECKYLNFSDIYFIGKNVFYTARMDESNYTMYKVDLNRDIIQKIYKANGTHLSAICKYKEKFYFFEIKQTALNKKTIQRYNLKSVDINTESIADHGYMPDKYVDTAANIFYIGNNKFYFEDLDKIFTTDLSFENEKLIYNISKNESVGDYYYDEKTDELFFIIRDQKNNTGAIYVYSNDKLKKIDMPHENIYCFQLTNSKIYYSPYNPIFYGIAADFQRTEIYDYTGGKIYETDRNNRKESKLIFDSEKEFIIYNPFNSYIVIGDYLYFDNPELIEDGEFTYFSVAHKLEKVRINLKENTIKYIKFE